MIEKFYTILTFCGVWLLYIFPLYQGALELTEPNRLLKKFQKTGDHYPKISPWYWLIPPLKIQKEKNRGIKILRHNIKNEKEMDRLYRYFNKAVAWYYIAIAGVLNGIVATHEFFTVFFQNKYFLGMISVDILLIIAGFYHVHYRLKNTRKKRLMKKIFTNDKYRDF
ncbi:MULTISPECIES: hypothetical protein [Enterococcus]|jgi:hypothetical protein|uniref:Glycosyl-4,4'-diaponeurosporenoate acyltransferase n=1 Tax=Enterococcus dispar ATCC 51266 TaxID=1139219 RepID=S1P295_9ENTE|nr:hypothetical protein [Enterococcus dispar]EOT41137.1 hypothetical protein OMK_01306 [Enterococcus dispar ATCC 51266]EOW87229.1 hypothetical protein I569_02600 [Enterococcus dispar ATCC 51266]MCU7356443.1 hypothetical protein [Enterococcus dispar]MDT2704517.1 hypothetical protein [Enterococcus dispar]OJG38712.1 hypothetical protein RV01_GL002158 [Enterococcus dispar]